MNIFDKKTINDWKIRNIQDVSISLVNKGCAGQKVLVTEEKNENFTGTSIQDTISIHMEHEHSTFFESAKITHVGNKWIVASTQVNTRCGCGSSFSLKTTPIQDKIAQMKLAIKQKKEGIHN